MWFGAEQLILGISQPEMPTESDRFRTGVFDRPLQLHSTKASNTQFGAELHSATQISLQFGAEVESGTDLTQCISYSLAILL